MNVEARVVALYLAPCADVCRLMRTIPLAIVNGLMTLMGFWNCLASIVISEFMKYSLSRILGSLLLIVSGLRDFQTYLPFVVKSFNIL